jgi:ABC-type branched-subunit amino acid transport system permease subunit
MGLLLLRLAASLLLGADGLTSLRNGPPVALGLYCAGIAIPGLLQLIGLWTPIAGTLLAQAAITMAIALPACRWSWVVLAILAAAIALLGPGAWSVDARRYGWRRLEFPDRKRDRDTPNL